MGQQRESDGIVRTPADGAPRSRLEDEASDRRVWSRVLVLALVGFAAGVAWPKLTGVRFGPNAPGGESASAGRAPEKPEAAVVVAPIASGAPLASGTEAAAAPLPTVASTVKVAESFVLGCTTKDGETKKGPDCGPYRELDKLAEPKLRRLILCPAARTATGHISLVASLDFPQRRLDASLGKSTALQNADAAAVLACLRTELEGLDIAAMPHEHTRYTLVYKVDLEAGAAPSVAPVVPQAVPGEPAAAAPAAAQPSAAPAAAAGGTTAEVTWEVAIVRSSPRTGDVIARLPRGSKLKLSTADNGWWHIHYGDNFGSEGWVYRGAIGR